MNNWPMRHAAVADACAKRGATSKAAGRLAHRTTIGHSGRPQALQHAAQEHLPGIRVASLLNSDLIRAVLPARKVAQAVYIHACVHQSHALIQAQAVRAGCLAQQARQSLSLLHRLQFGARLCCRVVLRHIALRCRLLVADGL